MNNENMNNEKRVPIAITAEAAALSLLAADPDLLSSIAWDASYFALDGHRAIFTAMETLCRGAALATQ